MEPGTPFHHPSWQQLHSSVLVKKMCHNSWVLRTWEKSLWMTHFNLHLPFGCVSFSEISPRTGLYSQRREELGVNNPFIDVLILSLNGGIQYSFREFMGGDIDRLWSVEKRPKNTVEMWNAHFQTRTDHFFHSYFSRIGDELITRCEWNHSATA